jgi:hypothetical protein
MLAVILFACFLIHCSRYCESISCKSISCRRGPPSQTSPRERIGGQPRNRPDVETAMPSRLSAQTSPAEINGGKPITRPDVETAIPPRREPSCSLTSSSYSPKTDLPKIRFAHYCCEATPSRRDVDVEIEMPFRSSSLPAENNERGCHGASDFGTGYANDPIGYDGNQFSLSNMHS